MSFLDHVKVNRNYNRAVIDTAEIESTGTTTTNFVVKDNLWQTNMLVDYKLQFFTGQLAGVFYTITANTTNSITAAPDQGIVPADGDEFAIIDFEAGGISIKDIYDALTESPHEVICNNADISGGVNHFNTDIFKWRRSSLFIRTGGAINITLEFAPENGGLTDFYEPDDSPLTFSAAGEDIFEINYKWKGIQLTGSNANLVTAKILGGMT
jgi:hypothetical protein